MVKRVPAGLRLAMPTPEPRPRTPRTPKPPPTPTTPPTPPTSHAGAGGARRKSPAARRNRPAAPAEAFAQTRRAHASELAEDYAEIIAELIDTTGEARVVDIAKRVGVSHVTVIRTLARMQKSGLVTTRPYRSVFLTDEGRRVARDSKKRHEVVLEFLLALGVPAAAARADAEGIEHHVSPQTLAAFAGFTSRSGGAERAGGGAGSGAAGRRSGRGKAE